MRTTTTMQKRATLAPRALALAGLIALALAALSARGAGAQTPARTSELAPIEAVEIQALKSLPVQYQVLVTSGLPGGCASFGSIAAQRTGTRVDVTVRNTMPAGPVPCTAIYGYARNTVNIGSDFQAGITYTVVVNGVANSGGTRGVTKTFTTASVSPAPDPGAPPSLGTPPVPPPVLVPRPANTGTGGVAHEIGHEGTQVEAMDALIGGGVVAAAGVAVALIALRVPRRRAGQR